MDAAGQLAQLGRGLLELGAEPLEERADARRVLGEPPAGDLDVEHEADEPLLRAVVQVALDLAPGGVGGLEDALARGAQLGRARGLDLVGQQRGLGGAALGDVEQRAVQPQPPAGAGDGLAAVEHPAHLAVGAHDPVLEHERLVVLGRVRDGLEHHLDVVGMDDREDRALVATERKLGGG